MDVLFVTLPNVVDIIIQVPIFVGLSERVLACAGNAAFLGAENFAPHPSVCYGI